MSCSISRAANESPSTPRGKMDGSVWTWSWSQEEDVTFRQSNSILGRASPTGARFFEVFSIEFFKRNFQFPTRNLQPNAFGGFLYHPLTISMPPNRFILLASGLRAEYTLIDTRLPGWGAGYQRICGQSVVGVMSIRSDDHGRLCMWGISAGPLSTKRY